MGTWRYVLHCRLTNVHGEGTCCGVPTSRVFLCHEEFRRPLCVGTPLALRTLRPSWFLGQWRRMICLRRLTRCCYQHGCGLQLWRSSFDAPAEVRRVLPTTILNEDIEDLLCSCRSWYARLWPGAASKLGATAATVLTFVLSTATPSFTDAHAGLLSLRRFITTRSVCTWCAGVS